MFFENPTKLLNLLYTGILCRVDLWCRPVVEEVYAGIFDVALKRRSEHNFYVVTTFAAYIVFTVFL